MERVALTFFFQELVGLSDGLALGDVTLLVVCSTGAECGNIFTKSFFPEDQSAEAVTNDRYRPHSNVLFPPFR